MHMILLEFFDGIHGIAEGFASHESRDGSFGAVMDKIFDGAVVCHTKHKRSVQTVKIHHAYFSFVSTKFNLHPIHRVWSSMLL